MCIICILLYIHFFVLFVCVYTIDKGGGGLYFNVHVSKCIFCLIDNKCILSVTVFVCHDKRNVFFPFCIINSPVLCTGNS